MWEFRVASRCHLGCLVQEIETWHRWLLKRFAARQPGEQSFQFDVWLLPWRSTCWRYSCNVTALLICQMLKMPVMFEDTP